MGVRVMADRVYPNDRYIVQQIVQLGGTGANALDFGCGAGRIVRLAREHGINMVGADIFYAGNETRRHEAHATGQMGKTLFEMKDGRLPFPDRHFDFVCSNQVFEHVEDIDLALSEICRVLKSRGTFINIFPSAGVLREGHCGVLVAHWLNRFPMLQIGYLYLWRLFGFGYSKNGKSHLEWARGFSAYLRQFTCYRRMKEIHAAYERHGFIYRHVEHRLAWFRLQARSWRSAAHFVISGNIRKALARRAVRRLGGMVILARPHTHLH